MCSNIAFIFIRSYRLALLARTLCGLTVANSAIARSYIAETTTEGSRPGAFAALNVFSILGMIAGPLIGGFLSRPTTAMPGSVLDNEFLSERVYSFPFVVLACLSLLVLITTVIGLKESKSVKKSEPLLESQHYR
jgi:MFS family permease